MDQISLARQVNLALERLTGELTGMSAGTIVLQIRNDEVGKFGIRHLPVECGTVEKENVGLTVEQAVQLRKLAVDALRHKRGWTHGEIAFDFALRQGKMNVSVQFESNYNMANILFRRAPQNRTRRDVSSE
jgi:hypothetical protein